MRLLRRPVVGRWGRVQSRVKRERDVNFSRAHECQTPTFSEAVSEVSLILYTSLTQLSGNELQTAGRTDPDPGTHF